MELIGYDITLEPTGLHKITLDCIGSEDDLVTIRKVYNTGVWHGIGLSKSCVLEINNKKENKTMTATELRRIEEEGYAKGYERGKIDGFIDGRKGSAPLIDKFHIGQVLIKKVIFNDPATIVFWADGTKTVAKAHGDDKFDKEIGLTVCIAKKAMGNKKKWDQIFKKWIKD